jgi:transcriptional regulator NrdR family protein
MKCPQCNNNESKGLLPLLQKDGIIIYEVDLCEKCSDELIEDWIK